MGYDNIIYDVPPSSPLFFAVLCANMVIIVRIKYIGNTWEDIGMTCDPVTDVIRSRVVNEAVT